MSIVAYQTNPSYWYIFRFTEFDHEIPSSYLVFIKCNVKISDRYKITCKREPSAQDLNAEDWVVCYGLDFDEVLAAWVKYQTQNWPGDYKNIEEEREYRRIDKQMGWNRIAS